MKSMCLLFSRLACLLCLDQRHKIVIAEILASPFDRGLVCSSVQRPRSSQFSPNQPLGFTAASQAGDPVRRMLSFSRRIMFKGATVRKEDSLHRRSVFVSRSWAGKACCFWFLRSCSSSLCSATGKILANSRAACLRSIRSSPDGSAFAA